MKRALSQQVISEIFNDSLRHDYLMLAFQNKFFFIISKSENIYREYYIYIDLQGKAKLYDYEMESVKADKETEIILTTMFDYSLYKEYENYQDFLIQTNQKLESCCGTSDSLYSFYFYLANNKGENVVEMIVPCLATRPVPFDEKVYDYIYYKFIEFYKDCYSEGKI